VVVVVKLERGQRKFLVTQFELLGPSSCQWNPSETKCTKITCKISFLLILWCYDNLILPGVTI